MFENVGAYEEFFVEIAWFLGFLLVSIGFFNAYLFWKEFYEILYLFIYYS